MDLEFKKFLPIAESFVKLLYPFAEVVVHDLKKGQIAAIYNSFSNRQVSDNSYLDHWDFITNFHENVIGPYKKTNFDGRSLKSISLVLRNDQGKAIGLICINVDISVFKNYQDTIQIFLSNNDKLISDRQENLFKDDLYDQINMFIQDYCFEHHLNIETLKKEHKQTLILKLRDKGAFKGKNATNYIARILNLSRASIYNYMKEIT